LVTLVEGDARDFTALIERKDPDKKARRALHALQPLHLKVAAVGLLIEAVASLLDLLVTRRFKHTVYWRQLLERVLRTKKDAGVDIIDSTTSLQTADWEKFLQSDTNQEDDEWLIMPDPVADELLKQKDPEKYKMRLTQRKNKIAAMELRYEMCRQWADCIWAQLKNPEIQTMIREKNPALFRCPEFYSQISWLSDKNWLFGLEVDEKGNPLPEKERNRDAKGEPLDPTAYPINTAEAYLEIESMDKVEQKRAAKAGLPPPEPVLPQFWQKLNNVLLIVEAELTLDDEMLNRLLAFVRTLYDDVMTGKVKSLTEVPKLVMSQLATLLPNLQSDHGNKIMNFIIEVMCQNIGFFRLLNKYIPKKMLTLAGKYGVPLGDPKADVDTVMETQFSRLLAIREARKQNASLAVKPSE